MPGPEGGGRTRGSGQSDSAPPDCAPRDRPGTCLREGCENRLQVTSLSPYIAWNGYAAP